MHNLIRLSAAVLNLALQLMPVFVMMGVDRYRKQWRGWRYYALVSVLALAMVWAVLGTLYVIQGHH